MAEGSSHGGYDFKPKNNCPYECPICKKIIRKFTELPCFHATCRSCLEQWEQKRFEMLKQIGEGDQFQHNCITCNQVYDLNNKHFSGASDRIILNDLEVLCKLYEEGCQWFGTIADYQHHSDKECQFQPIHCRFNGCKEQFQRKFQTNHEASCKERERNCHYCNNVIKLYNERHHHQIECSRFPTECPNQDCQRLLPRNKIDEHRENECPQQEIPCIYSDIGCDLKVKRCHLQHHENEFNATHTKLLFKELRKTKEQLLATTKIVQKMQTELQDTKSKLEATTKIAQKTQTELQDTKSKLETTTKIVQKMQTELQDTKSKLEATTKLAKETQSELKDTKEELDRVKEELKTKKEKVEEKCVVKPNPATAPKVSSLKAEVKVVDVVRLMGELVQSNPPRTTQQTYAEKIQLVFNEINEGQLFHINDNECFFKLRLQQNHRKFCIDHVDDVTSYRNKDTKFTNDVVTLNDFRSWGYDLCVAIEKYDEKNCRSYVINVKECGKNHLLKYDGNDDIRWELYKNKNDEVIFYFKKN